MVKMSVDYNELVETLENENMNGETTYTKKEARELAQEWLKNQRRTTLQNADQQMRAARQAYFQAVREYKQAYSGVNAKKSRLETALNSCYFKSDKVGMTWVPESLGLDTPSTALMEVPHNKVVNI